MSTNVQRNCDLFFQILLIFVVKKNNLFIPRNTYYAIRHKEEQFLGEKTRAVTLIHYSVQCNTVWWVFNRFFKKFAQNFIT